MLALILAASLAALALSACASPGTTYYTQPGERVTYTVDPGDPPARPCIVSTYVGDWRIGHVVAQDGCTPRAPEASP